MIEHYTSIEALPTSWKRRLAARGYKCCWCNNPIFKGDSIVTVSHRLGKQLLVSFYHRGCKNEQENTEKSCREG